MTDPPVATAGRGPGTAVLSRAARPSEVAPPEPRGPVGSALLDVLTRPAPPGPPEGSTVAALRRWQATVQAALADPGPLDAPRPDGPAGEPIIGDDVQVALHLAYTLHLHGSSGVDEGWEWQPDLLAGVRMIERAFEAHLRRRAAELYAVLGVGVGVGLGCGPDPRPAQDLRQALIAITDAPVGPSLSSYVRDEATLAQVREFLVLKSIYQLKEADPHTFSIPRLQGRAKAAAVEIQGDEYGNGTLRAMHSQLYRVTMQHAGLDERLGAYLDLAPAAVLASDNAAVMFGLHRRLRAAAIGHLCALEVTSSAPMRRYARGLRRVGLPPEAAEYFLEHVGVDAVHEQVAVHDMVVPLVAADPALRADVLLGAATATLLDGDLATAAVAAWASGRSALRGPLP